MGGRSIRNGRVLQVGRNLGHQPTHAHGLLILERSPLGHFQIGLGVLQERTRVLVSAVEGLVSVVLLVAHRSPSPKGYRRMVLLV
jgi:hypothetical protein